MKKKKTTQVTLPKSFEKKAFLPFIAVFAAIGTGLLVLSYAATQQSYTIEPENGTLNNMSALTDNATGASYVTNKVAAPVNNAVFTQNFDSGTNAASVNMTDMSGSGIPVHINPDGTPFLGKIAISGGRVGTDPNPLKHDNYATANGTFSADQFAEADLIIGSSVSNQYTGVDVRANLTGPIYSWYKLETVSSSSQMRILALQNNRIAAEYYADIPGGLQPNRTYRIRLEVTGSTLRAYFERNLLNFRLPNGTYATSVTDYTISNGKPGLHVDGFQSWIDNFSAGSLGTTTTTTTTTTPTTTTNTQPQAPVPVTPPTTAGSFYTKNGLVGRDGRRFVPIGVNGVIAPRGAPVGSWWNEGGQGVMNGRAAAYKALGFNFVRLTLAYDPSSGYSQEDFFVAMESVIDEYTAQGITVMPAWHGFAQGINISVAQLSADSNYLPWLDRMVARYKNNPNVWMNPLNEPWNYTAIDQWQVVGTWLYNRIRSAGFTNIIVWDLPGWAQGIQYAAGDGRTFVTGKTNVVLGFHNYDMGDATAQVRAAQAVGVPVIIGEAGETMSGGNKSSFEWSVANADTLGIGFVGWWGAGNRNDHYVMRNQRGSAWYETQYPLNNYGQKLWSLAANRPVQPPL